MMRRVLPVAVALFASVPAASPVPAEVANRVILRVNDQIATLYDFEQDLATQRRVLNSASGLEPDRRQELLESLPRTVLETVFDRLLVESRAAQLGIVVTDFELDEAIAQVRRDNGLEDDRQFEAALRNEGLSLEDLRERFRYDQLRRQLMGQEVRQRVELTDQDLRQIYREREDDFRVPPQVKLREIVVFEGAGAEELASSIRAELEGGASLEEVAERHGERVSGVLDIGWVSPGELAGAIEAAVWELEPGQVSEPVEARGGLHIAEVLERREGGVRPYEEVEDELYSAEFGRRIVDEFGEYLGEIAGQAYIRCIEPEGVEGFCAEKAQSNPGAFRRSSGASGLEDVDRLFAPSDDRTDDAAAPPTELEQELEQDLELEEADAETGDEPPRRR